MASTLKVGASLFIAPLTQFLNTRGLHAQWGRESDQLHSLKFRFLEEDVFSMDFCTFQSVKKPPKPHY